MTDEPMGPTDDEIIVFVTAIQELLPRRLPGVERRELPEESMRLVKDWISLWGVKMPPIVTEDPLS